MSHIIGYHLKPITKGVYGELSKVQEELDEAMDAIKQNSSILLLVELADMYGALEAVALKHGTTMQELSTFSNITKRAFTSGARS